MNDMPNPEDLLPAEPDEDQEPTPAPAKPENQNTLERVDGTTQEIRSYLMERDPEGSGEDELLTTVREALHLLVEIAEARKTDRTYLEAIERRLNKQDLLLQAIRDSV